MDFVARHQKWRRLLFKNIIYRCRHNPPLTDHGMRLTRTCLSISKDADVFSINETFEKLADFSKYIFLILGVHEHPVESEDLTAHRKLFWLQVLTLVLWSAVLNDVLYMEVLASFLLAFKLKNFAARLSTPRRVAPRKLLINAVDIVLQNRPYPNVNTNRALEIR